MKEAKARNSERVSIKKAPTGIQGLDEITEGGLPAGRPTLVCGGAGKTMLATEFLVRGAMEFDEPGVYVMFEERADELAENVRSVMVADIGMPDMDGYELLAKICSEYPAYNIPAIALTAFASPKDREDSL